MSEQRPIARIGTKLASFENIVPLMAMSSDASPIIGVLEDLSSRVLNARSRNEALLLSLAQERLRTVEAQRKLEQMPPDASSAEAIRAVLEAFNPSAGEEERSE